MLFNSVEFGIFFVLVCISYWTFFHPRLRLRNIFIIAVSYLFYGWWDWRFLSLIVISSLVDYIAGRKIYNSSDAKIRKRWLLLSLIVNLGFLGFFKYFNFFVDSFVDAFALMGVSLNPVTLDIILPVGISFYTFQTLSYTLDIYYNRLKPTHDAFSFFAFVAFFPQLVAGPIERARHLLPQFHSVRKIDYEMLRSGLLLMGWGFFKKIVIADRLARLVDSAYADIPSIDGPTSIFAVIFFAFQLYLDFSAYSDIAIGTARCFGFNLSTNFLRPYLSTSFSNFWKRWHISLSSWFKDYVYIPLGGNRVPYRKVVRNILIVFALSGLWHGASWNFVIWGLLNALFILVLDKYLIVKLGVLPAKRFFVSGVIFLAWAVSLIFFRAQTFHDALLMFSQLGSPSKELLYTQGINSFEFHFAITLLLLYMSFEAILEKNDNLYIWFISRNFLLRWVAYIMLIISIIMLGSYGVGLDDNQFIYFQF